MSILFQLGIYDKSSILRLQYKYTVHHFKWNPTKITYYGTTIKSEAGPPPYNTLSQPPHDVRVKDNLAARLLLTQTAQKFAGANMVYSRGEHVFIHKHLKLLTKHLAAVFWQGRVD
jgi:hypothetical protein